MGNEKANCADTQIKVGVDVEADTTNPSYLFPKTSDSQCQPVWIIVIIGIAILVVLVVPPLLRAILGKHLLLGLKSDILIEGLRFGCLFMFWTVQCV